MPNKVIKRILILGISTALLLGSASLRLGNVAPDDITNTAMIGSVESWHSVSEQELIKQAAIELQANNIKQAKHYAYEALKTNPSSGQAVGQLLEVYQQDGDAETADQLAILAAELWPAHSLTRAGLADYWLSRGNLARLLPEWNNVLIRKPATYSKIFPALQKLLNSEQTAPLLLPYIQNPPDWWPAFFSYLTRNDESIESLKAVYALRADSDQSLTERERTSFVNRLLREKLPQEAYYVWLSGLDTESFKLTGLIYDGGFEGTSFNTGFDWQIARAKGLTIRTNTTSGVTGSRALQISLNTKRLNFNHLSQRLVLVPGNYQLSGRYRLNRLRTTEGLRWRIYCANNNQKIAESESFHGRTPWQTFSVDFSITDDNCTSQLLRLEASSRYAHHHEFKGSLWFDDISISRQVTGSEGQIDAQ